MLFAVHDPFTPFLVKEWWNQDSPFYNFNHDFEQSAIRQMILDSHVAVAHMTYVKEPQFEPYANRQWLHHFTSRVDSHRINSMKSLIYNHIPQLSNASVFEEVVDHMQEHQSFSINILNAAETIERFEYESLRREASNSDYYLTRAPNRKGIYKIQYNMKRFVSEEAFAFWKFNIQDVRNVSDEFLDSLTLGPVVITTTSIHSSVI